MTKEQIIKNLVAQHEGTRWDADTLRSSVAQDLNNDYMDELMELVNDDHIERENLSAEIESEVVDRLEEMEE